MIIIINKKKILQILINNLYIILIKSLVTLTLSSWNMLSDHSITPNYPKRRRSKFQSEEKHFRFLRDFVHLSIKAVRLSDSPDPFSEKARKEMEGNWMIVSHWKKKWKQKCASSASKVESSPISPTDSFFPMDSPTPTPLSPSAPLPSFRSVCVCVCARVFANGTLCNGIWWYGGADV